MKAQTKWSWLIAIYLFLAGLGGGAYVAGVLADIAGWDTALAKSGILIGFPCVLIGSVLLIFDLGKPVNFWRAFMRPGTSWMARGSIIISIFMVLNFLHIILWIWPFPDVMETSAGLRHFIEIPGVFFAFGTMFYTGVLLSASRPIAFWSTAMLPLLFMVSALSTGFMSVILVNSFEITRIKGLMALEKMDIILLIAEIFILLFYLQATHRVSESRASVKIVTGGAVAPLFWIGVVMLGLTLPLALDLTGLYALSESGAHTTAIAAAISGIIGGLCLRQVILTGGIHAPLKSGLFEYGLTNV